MYNSFLKYQLKSILGKKNSAWYFDKLSIEYNRKYNRDIEQALDWSLNLSRDPNFKSKSEVNGEVNSLFKLGYDLRREAIDANRDALKERGLKILLHTPPFSISVGANSWLRNLQMALIHMGVKVELFWDDLNEEMLKDANYIFGIGNYEITNTINWNIVNQHKNKSELKVLLQCTFDVEDRDAAQTFIEYYRLLNVDFFFSFDSNDFNLDFGLKQLFIKNKTDLFSIEFSANPLVHYPAEYVSGDFDFVFLGSSNYDKIERYNEYFVNVFKEYKGLVAGPGWPWSSNYELILERDRYLYSRAKIALNLHLDTQIKLSRQLNERAYIIAACGIAQVTDNPRILPEKFRKIGIVANNYKEYLNGIKGILFDENIRKELAINALNEVYEKHTVFHRIMNLFRQIPFANYA